MLSPEPQVAALVAHITSQVENHLRFLAAQGHLSQPDLAAILSKLPRTQAEEADGGASQYLSPAASFRSVPPVPSVVTVQARARWAYNENGQEAEDLSFVAGDLIEVIEETNADWWRGKAHGREGIFPSTYVEKIQMANPSPLGPKPVYKPFGAAYQGMDAPPPSGQGVNASGLQQVDQTQKSKKFGKFGNTIAHSAVGGVGFGAGAAIGGGLVNAIF